jgi:hypothetical protein
MAGPEPRLRVGRRFRGPPGMGNGGYVSGLFAALAGGAAEVTLRRPVPLERPLAARRADDGTLVVEDEGRLLAEVRAAAAVELAAPAVTLGQARAVAGRSRYYDDPVFPSCFVCGPDRAPGDGLRIFPGTLAATGPWAAPWTPDRSVSGTDGTVRPEIVWAALDCPSGIAAAEAALPDGGAVLLGRMTATVAGRPRAGRDYAVVAWPGPRDGRKLAATSALLDPDGAVLAAAATVWLTVSRVPVGA